MQLHDVNEWFHNYPYTIGMLGWKFNDREAIIRAKASTTLNGALAIGDASMVLTSGTNFDSPPITADFPAIGGGYVRFGTYIYDFFVHEGKTANMLTTVSGLQMAHVTAENVNKIYPLPSNYGKMRSVFRQSNVIEYQYMDQDMRQIPPFGYYMLKSFTSTNSISGTFFILPENIGAIDFKLYYMIKANTIAATTDSINAPDGDGRQAVIEKMCEYVWGILGEDNLAVAAAQKAEDKIDKCLGKWSLPTASTNQSLQLLW